MINQQQELNFFDGFTIENDIFKRKPFYQSLIKVIENSPEKNLVISLDDQWGQGKTSFIKMMHGQIKKEHSDEFNTIYFDAYENDYHSDPFIPIAAEFYSIFNTSENNISKYKNNFLEVTKRVGAATLIGALKAVITTSTASLINGNQLVDATIETAKNASESLTDSLESYVEEKIVSAEEEKADIENFRYTLSKIHKESGKKTIFIIDELDRAKPDFSLDLLEKVKHLFSVDGVVFILVMNKSQFENSIIKRYGGIDSKSYLNKFISYFLTLPKIKTSDHNQRGRVGNSTIHRYIESIKQINSLFEPNSNIHLALSYLLEVNDCSLREAERCISFLFIVAKGDEKLNYAEEYEFTLALMVFLKVFDSRYLNAFLDRKLSEQEVFAKLNLHTDLARLSIFQSVRRSLINMIQFYLLTQEKKDADFESMQRRYPNVYLFKGCKTDPFVKFKDEFENFSVE